MIMARLKQETRVYHDQLEANSYSRAMMDGTITSEIYSEMLGRFYGFYQPLEAQLQAAAPAELQPRLVKSSLLAQDLRALGYDLLTVPVCADVPQINSVASAYGSLYVLEGATLGGQVISRQLRKLGFSVDHGASFFNSYGERVGDMWKAFIASTSAYAEVHGGEDEMVAAACDTFITFERWLSRTAVSV